ncbi:hypothetical protein Psi01_24130 [Planobispora siamensis]|uniref:Uncharacterized protein n=1 Tax=Planobispora siamensis TaxID=936338 RepID=A0A8J3SLI0_9ACTN|nr:hypothetical protein Psi01_24130 [Planobispora siamensis]
MPPFPPRRPIQIDQGHLGFPAPWIEGRTKRKAVVATGFGRHDGLHRSGQAQQDLDGAEGEVQDEQRRDHPHQRVDLAGLALDQLDQDVGDEARADSVGDGGRLRHPPR